MSLKNNTDTGLLLLSLRKNSERLLLLPVSSLIILIKYDKKFSLNSSLNKDKLFLLYISLFLLFQSTLQVLLYKSLLLQMYLNSNPPEKFEL